MYKDTTIKPERQVLVDKISVTIRRSATTPGRFELIASVEPFDEERQAVLRKILDERVLSNWPNARAPIDAAFEAAKEMMIEFLLKNT